MSTEIVANADPRELKMYFEKFATMIDAGLSLVRVLEVLEEQSAGRLKDASAHLIEKLQSGETLSRAMSQFPDVFSPLCIGLVRAGEVGGVLDETLNRYAKLIGPIDRFEKIGRAYENLKMSVWCETLGTLLISGVPLLQALETVAGAHQDFGFLQDVHDNFKEAIERKEKQKLRDPCLYECFPEGTDPMIIQMIAVGEETGSLDRMFFALAEYYREQSEI